MKYGSLILEKKEYVYLKRILNISGYAEDHETQRCLMNLSEELKTAHIVDEEDMPKDVIRFNSTVTVTFNNGVEKTLQLVIPMDKDFQNSRISVLTPMGSALIGYSEGDSIIWDFPNGTQQITISKVQQKETYSGIDIVI
ncbi:MULTISPECIES: GreA/GreB family elongation factor [Winogradskyella]|uniref:GreA/GreB family elongation factor n=1 Tax=Winogradskyella TaxID=286104 RepID=UPI001B0CDF92|nr:GreA/GreB family elongation factor [Winogradskyella sp.]MBO6881636.1 GreA/GreB family elongation factor [Winogradskyella sp.]